MIAAAKRKRTQEYKWWGFGHRAGLAGGAGNGGGAGHTPCHLALGAPMVPSMDMAPLGGTGSFGVGRSLMKRGCANAGVPGCE